MKQKELLILEDIFPLTYREDVCSQMAENFRNGESFSFIGMEDNCKVNILRFFAFRKDVQKKYFLDDADKYLFIFIDLNELSQISLVGFYHLIGLSLVETLQKQTLKFSYLNNLFIDNPGVLLKSLKEDIAHVSRVTGKTIVFLFNNFDLLKDVDLEILANNLTALRSVSKYRVICVYTGLRPFSAKRVFFQKVIYMTPFNNNDAIGVVERNMRRYRVSLVQKQIGEVIRLSGGHGGLIKFIVQVISRDGILALKEDVLKKNSDICFQCERILAPLTNIEKAKLKTGEKDDLLSLMGIQSEKTVFISHFPLSLPHI